MCALMRFGLIDERGAPGLLRRLLREQHGAVAVHVRHDDQEIRALHEGADAVRSASREVPGGDLQHVPAPRRDALELAAGLAAGEQMDGHRRKHLADATRAADRRRGRLLGHSGGSSSNIRFQIIVAARVEARLASRSTNSKPWSAHSMMRASK